MTVGLRIGIHDALSFVTSSPDGVRMGMRGQKVIDATTGITWRNEDGATRWDPADVPSRWGFIYETDWVGVIGMNQGASGTGATTQPAAGTTTNHGVVGLTVTATATPDNVRVRSGGTPLVASGGKIFYESIVKVTTLEDGTNRFSQRIGFGNNSTSDQTNGIYFEADLATHGDTKWRAVTANNGTRKKTDTGVTATAGAYQHYRIKTNAAGTSVQFFIDDVLVATNTENIPNTVGREFDPLFQVIKTLGSATREIVVDYMKVAKVNSTVR